jgi:hypothetical protein
MPRGLPASELKKLLPMIARKFPNELALAFAESTVTALKLTGEE